MQTLNCFMLFRGMLGFGVCFCFVFFFFSFFSMLGFHLKIFLFSLLFVGVAYLVPQYKPWEHPRYVSQ